jgi:hypothetical protein
MSEVVTSVRERASAVGRSVRRRSGRPPRRAASAGDEHLAWVQAYQESQRQTSEAHAAYLQDDGRHACVLPAHGGVLVLWPERDAHRSADVHWTTVSIGQLHRPRRPRRLRRAGASSSSPRSPLPLPLPWCSQRPSAAPVVAALRSRRSLRLRLRLRSSRPPLLGRSPGLMLSIVAEKTGYPVEMLALPDGARGRPRASTPSSASRSSRRCASAPRACPR